MCKPDIDAAARYALEQLERRLPSTLVYHSLGHTRDEVVPAAERLAALEGVGGDALLLLRTAAYFHDIGFVQRRDNHEDAGALVAAQMLPSFGYGADAIAAISGMIMATRVPQTPHTLLEQILADADLDVLGRKDFWVRNQALRHELASAGQPMDDITWLQYQLRFLQSHSYWTRAARALRGQRKEQHIAELRQLLAEQLASGERAPDS